MIDYFCEDAPKKFGLASGLDVLSVLHLHFLSTHIDFPSEGLEDIM
jgi:hypothetical protein